MWGDLDLGKELRVLVVFLDPDHSIVSVVNVCFLFHANSLYFLLSVEMLARIDVERDMRMRYPLLNGGFLSRLSRSVLVSWF